MKNRVRFQGEALALKPGAHAALLFSDPAEGGAALAFIAEGLAHGERCAILAYGRFDERVEAQLRDLHGVDTRGALQSQALAILDAHEGGRQMLAELQRFFAAGPKSERRGGRLLCSLGWGEAGWPDESELLAFDAQLDALCGELRIAALCLYDARQLSGALVLHGALECHSLVLSRGTLHKNPLRVDPSQLRRELVARRREETRLRSWMR